MKRRIVRQVALAALALLSAVALCGCTAAAPKPANAAPSIKSAPAASRITQLGFGSRAYYAVCTGAGCGAATPKTLATIPAAVVNTAASAAQPPSPIPAAVVVPTSATVFFATDSASLDAAARRVLDTVVPRLEGDVRVVVRGRTDSVGSIPYNTALARRRALAVRAYLSHAAPAMASRIQLDARGDCCFAASNASAAGRAKNRRSVVKVVPARTSRAHAAVPR